MPVKNQTLTKINCSQISPPLQQPLVAVYKAFLDIYFNKNSEDRLKLSSAEHLSLHLLPIFIKQICNQQYQLLAGYRQYHLAENLGIKSLPALIATDMTTVELFEFAITNCVVQLLAFDTKESKTTNKQLREFYSSLKSNLGADFSKMLKSPYLTELLNIPRSHLRQQVPAKKSALELLREELETERTSELDSKNIMYRYSTMNLHTAVKTPAVEKETWMEKAWVQYLSNDQVKLLKIWLSKPPHEPVITGNHHA